MAISANIIIPAYNEEARIARTILALGELLKDVDENVLKVKTYLVDDGSTDFTQKVAAAAAKKAGVDLEIYSYGRNRGKGYAVKFGMLNSESAHYYYLADADLSSPWETFIKLLEIAEKEGYDCVVSSRNMPDSDVNVSSGKQLGGRVANYLIRKTLRIEIRDTQCGYKLFAGSCKRAFKLQELERWGFDFEVLFLIRKLGLSTKEVGIKWDEVKEGSKVGLTAYFKTLSELLKVRTNKYKLH